MTSEKANERVSGNPSLEGAPKFKHPPVTPESRKRKLEHAKASLHIVPDGEPRTPQERGFDECPCKAKRCPLRNDCHLCYANHVSHGGLPKCLR